MVCSSGYVLSRIMKLYVLMSYYPILSTKKENKSSRIPVLFVIAHTKVSTNGALRIFHARMEDAGVYTCLAGDVQGNVTLAFKPRDSTKVAFIVKLKNI